MKKGFTLVELLAVIIIIGLISVIIVPRVQNTISESKKNTYEASAYALEREASNFYMMKKTDSTQFTGCTYDFTNNINTCNGFEFTGKKPKNGILEIDSNGNIQFTLKFNKYCYTKRINTDNISIKTNCNEELNDMMLEIVTTGDGLYKSTTEPGRLIYRGENPNNYIWLDENGDKTQTSDELYRIVSYETDGTTKVVRNESIGSIAFDTETNRNNSTNGYFCNSEYGCNAWGNQSNTYYNGKTLSELNQDFYFYYYPDNQSSTFSIKPNNNFGIINDDSSLNTYLNTTYYNTLYFKDKIENHSFNVGAIYYGITVNSQVEYNGGDKGLLKEKQEEQSYKWNGKIALINLTEYVESSLNPTCTSVYSNYRYNSLYFYDTDHDGTKELTISGYDNWPCSNREFNWLAKGIKERSLTARADRQDGVYIMHNEGHFDNYRTSNSVEVRPAFYLKSEINLSGSGTSSNPYYIID